MSPAPATAAKDANGRRSLTEVAYEAIYRRIVTLAYEPGRHLEEGQLMKELAIGRTPIREALQRLSADLLVEAQPGKGVIVRPLTLQSTRAAFAALQIFELGVAGMAVRQDNMALTDEMRAVNDRLKTAIGRMDIFELVEANSRFHDLYARCSGNIYLIQGLHKVRQETNRLAYLSYGNEIEPSRSLQTHYDSVIKQHNQIIAAIAGRNEKKLKQVVVAHIEIFKNRIIHYLASS